jgi:HPt (histidine-containing phosphotransfer) domain-containing protein
MRELIELFISEMPGKINELRLLSDSGDLVKLQRLAHMLKGACGGYGFPTLGQAAAKIEDSLKSQAGASGSTDEALARITTDVRALIDLFGRVTNRPPR